MFNVTKKSIEWGEETLTLESGKVARQADGCVIATYGETSVMAAVTFAKKQKPGQDFFPLTINYQERTYAAGKIPGGFFKRHDLVNDPDMVAMIAASAALTISGAPFMGPIGACRVGFEDGEYILNPEMDDMHELRQNPEQRLDLVVAGTKDAVMMVESEAYELTEEEMLGAVEFAHEQIQPAIDLILDFAEDCAKEPFDFTPPDYSDLYKAVAKGGEKAMRAAYAISDKQERTAAVAAAKETAVAKLTEEQLEDENLGSALKKLESTVLRGDVVKNKKRIDGRDLDEIRDIVSEVGLLPRTHGSALFTRGETQGLVVTTLGTGDDEQMIDSLQGMYKSNFLTESNGSSSMASVCGGSLSMMDAGVPLKAPVAGVAMGLILEEDGSYAVLSDILGDEDHLGDMDFKVAGTENGITSLQMDIKVAGITPEIMKTALAQAKEGRMHTRHGSRPCRCQRIKSAKSSARAARSSARSWKCLVPRSTSTMTASSRSRRQTARPSRRPMT